MVDRPTMVLKHGEYINPVHRPLPAGSRQVEHRYGRATRTYRKDERAHDDPSGLGWIKAVYEHSIEYTSRTENLRGLTFTGAIVIASVFTAVVYLMLSLAFTLMTGDAYFAFLGVLAALGGGRRRAVCHRPLHLPFSLRSLPE